jgi:hypothetical protein
MAARQVCVLPSMGGLRAVVNSWVQENSLVSSGEVQDLKEALRRRAVIDHVAPRFNIPGADRILWPIHRE